MSHESRTSLTRIDPRGHFVFDTRALGRRAGSMREESRRAPAPEGVAVELIGVPPGAEIELDLRFEAVMEGVLVTGTAHVPLSGECARCLDPLSTTAAVGFQELFSARDEDAGGASGEEEYHLVGDLIDLEPVVRDAVVLALPLAPLCRDDCPGLCAVCGIRMAEAGPEHHHDAADPRFAVLRGLLEQPDHHDQIIKES